MVLRCNLINLCQETANIYHYDAFDKFDILIPPLIVVVYFS